MTGFFASTIGQKFVMAVTGALLFGFVLAHLAGNLLLYQGADSINAYGRELRELLHGAGIWILRVGLLVAVVLHVWAMSALTLTNRKARPVRYRQ
jgi:succinate dehydrogenase / fumarate reductase, cytochrome b subunit